MKPCIVVGSSERVVTAVLQGVFCTTGASSIVVGGAETQKLQWSSLCSKHFSLDFDGASDRGAVDLLNRISDNNPDAVIIPADCKGLRLVNRIRSALHAKVTPCPDLATLNQMDDKWQFYRFCQSHSLPVPETYFVGTKVNLDFDDLVGKLGLPFVLKPSNESGAHGVLVIRSREHYLQAVKNNSSYRFSSLIAQRYINGDDIDLSLLAIHGHITAYAIQQVKGASIEFVSNEDLRMQVTQLCSESSYHGVMHIDARIEKATGKVFLIESNPRFWATLTASIWCGLNFVEEVLREKPELRAPLRLVHGTAYLRHPLVRPAAWTTLFDSSQRGRLTRVTMLDAYALGQFMIDLPMLGYRYLSKQLSLGAHASRKANSLH